MRLPPRHLAAPPRWLRMVLTPIWAALMLIAVVAQVGGIWRSTLNWLYYNPPFSVLGLYAGDGSMVAGVPGVAQTSALANGASIEAIDSVGVPAEISYEELAPLLAGPIGSHVSVMVLMEPDPANPTAEDRFETFNLQRTEQNRQLADPTWQTIVDRIVVPLLSTIALGCALFASWKLWRRREDGVAQLLAVGLVLLVLTGEMPLKFAGWLAPNSLASDGVTAAVTLICITVLAVTIPAYPGGTYRPKWGGWLGLVAPVLLLIALPATVYFYGARLTFLHYLTPQNMTPFAGTPAWVDASTSQYPLFAALLIAVIAAWLRFRGTPPGREKQQFKWAALGIVFGLLLMFLPAFIASWAPLSDLSAVIAGEIVLILSALGMIAIPLGILMSLMGWRLNDADSAISRSAGYALISLLIGGLWAAMTSWINKLVGAQLSPSAAAGISTAVAAAVFVPARERILKWMEAKLQPALVRLRGLPAKLLPWRSDHNPADIARGTLLAVVNGINARSAALVLTEEGGSRVIATYETTSDEVLTDLAAEDPAARSFPLHIKLDDLIGNVGYLLIGPRSDDATYNSDERAAIKVVAGPLGEVLRGASRRADRDTALAQILTAVDARVARLEALRTSPSVG